ncbi:MAG: hypothetical protein WC028_06490 [Candidatus Obscuribacterales bacterium]
MQKAFLAQLGRFSRSSRFCISLLLCLGSLAGFTALPAHCQETAAISQCLKSSKYVSQAATAQFKIDGGCLELSLYQDPRAHIKDLKINSILLSKELNDAFPDAFETYVFAYFPVVSQNCYTQVVVAKRDLLLFASGKLTKSEILSRVTLEPFLANSLKNRYQGLSYGEILNYSDNENSKEIKQRILSLKSSGYDVAAAERQFLKMEDLARNKDEAAFEEAKVSLAKCLSDAPGKIRLANEGTLWPR